MNAPTSPHSLCEVLDRLDTAKNQEDPVSVGAVLDAVGRRSFGPLLLVAGLVMVAPIVGDIPGVPVLMGLVVLLTAGAMLLHRDHVWLPGWMLRRSVSRRKVDKTLHWIRPVARFLDRWSRPRLEVFTGKTGTYLIAAAAAAIAVTTPAMEVVPFAANVAGLAITAFGLSLIVHDGLAALVALAFTAATLGLVLSQLLGS